MNKLLRSLLLVTAAAGAAWGQASNFCRIGNTSPLPDAYVGQTNYAVQLTLLAGSGCASFSPSNYIWFETSGSLPPGLFLNSAGGAAGLIQSSPSPNTPGTFTFTVVGQSTVSTQPAQFEITVHPQIITTNALPAATRGVPYSTTLTHSGTSTAGYTWAISGTLPQGLTFNTSTGEISGTPAAVPANAPGTYPLTFRVTNAVGLPSPDKDLILVLNEQPVQILTSGTLPRGVVNRAYSTVLTASGGYPPYNWFISESGGTGLPNGLSLLSNGTITGTINDAAGTYTFRAEAASTSPGTSSQSRDFTLIVNPQVTITTTSLPAGLNGAAYGPVSLQASGGQGFLSWSVAAGSLPPGLSIDSGGSIVGTPTAAGTFNFTAAVTDSGVAPNANQTATRALSITILDALTITTASLPPATINQAYAPVQLTASGGQTPYTWGLTGSSLPNGMSLSPSGVLSGTPTQSGSFPLVVTLTDSSSSVGLPSGNQNASREFAFAVSAPALQITRSTLLNLGAVNHPYSDQITTQGGTAPLNFTITAGGLAPGLTLNSSTGVISGTPTAGSPTPSFTVRVVDFGDPQQSDEETFTLTVAPQLLFTTTSPLPGGIIGAPYSTVLQTSGGAAPISFGITTGSLPPGLVLNPSTGEISGTPQGPVGPSTFTVRATDTITPTPQTADRTFSITVASPLVITSTSPLTPGTRGTPYDNTITRTGGTGPFTFSVTAGALPAGISLNSSTGQLTGTPPTAGVSNFTIQIADSSSPQQVVGRAFTLSINAPTLSFTTPATLPPGSVGTAYNQTIGVSGGTSPFTYTITAGQLPASLSLNPSTGAITGTPTTAGTSLFTVQVQDATSPQQTISQQFSLTINPPALQITSTSPLPPGTVGTNYNFTLQAIGGTTPVNWSILSGGALPPNVTLNSSTGQLSGVPTTAGTFDFVAQAVDSSTPQQSDSVPLRLVINPATLTITTNSPLPQGTVGVPYDTLLVAAGGTPSFTWSLASGTLPANVTLNPSTGRLAGTPANPGTFNFTVEVRDSATPTQQVASKAFALTVNSGLTITNTSPLPAGTVGVTYTANFAATGGTGGLTWSVASGNVPPALTLNASTGVLTGNPNAAGTYNFTLQVQDQGSPQQTATKAFAVTINPPTLTISTNSPLPQGTAGVPYDTTLVATGGTPSLTWSVASGALPASVTLNASTGQIAGTPANPGTFNFTVEVRDSATPTQQVASRAFALTVNSGLTITNTSPLPAGTVGVTYTANFAATGGTGALTWSITTGSVPPPLTLNPSTGVLTGNPNAAGTYNFTLQVQDQGSPQQTASRAFAVTIIPALTITTNSPLTSGSFGAAYDTSLQASGGTPPYTWSVATGELPVNVTLNASTGQIAGTPGNAGTFNFTVEVRDSATPTPRVSSKAFSLTINSGLTITNASPLPTGTVGTTYTVNFTTTGGDGEMTWSVATGTLPPALTLNSSTGVLTGNPTTDGTYNFTLQVTNPSTEQQATKAFAVTIGNSTLTISTTSPLPTGTLGTNYNTPLATTGGESPFTWSVSAGALPGGITLNPSTGVLSGTPTAAGPFNFTVQVQDSSEARQTATRAFALTINPATLTISTTSPLTAGTLGTSYSTSFTATGGTTPHTWTLASGTLPQGVTLSTAGVLTGTPTNNGTFNFSVRVQDASTPQMSDTKPFALTINPATITITTTNPLPGGRMGEPYSQPLVATGGVTPYTWAIQSGALPAGVTLNPATGVLNGVPTVTGTFTFTARVTDSQTPTAQTATRQFSFSIAPPFLVISTASPLPTGTAGTPHAISFTATGGTAPYVWSLAPAPANVIPPGMTFSPSGVLSGTPTAFGSYSFTVIATDAGDPSQTTQKAFLIDIAPAPLVFSVSELPMATFNQAYSYQIPISGGVPPYTCVITSGALPQGITLSPACLLSGTPTQIGAFNFTLRVTDSRGTAAPFKPGGPVLASAAKAFADKSFTLVVDPGYPVITTVVVPSATALTPYSSSLSSLGGVAPYSYALQSGSLPAGLALTSNGQIIGTAAGEASTSFTVRVNDARGNTGSKTFTLIVSSRENQTDRVLEVATANMPEGTVGKAYGLVFAARNGVEPYTWSIGGLPPGFESNALGEVIGTPTQPGSFNVQVSVRDANGKQAIAGFVFVVKPGVIVITTDRVGNGRVDEPFSASFAANGGTAPYQFGILAGSLPPGLTLSTAGVLTGTPTVIGTFGFTISATDTTNARGEKAFTMVVQPARLQISTASLGNGAVGVAYAAAVGATGGTPPYSFSATGLPDGVSIDAATGGISGTPTRLGSFPVNVTVTDKDNQTASRTFTVEITSSIVITTNTIGNMSTGTPVNVGLSATGGQPPYSWSLASGSLPGGLGLGADGIISGTPNATGTFSFSVQVTDQNKTTATKGFTVTVGTRLDITTTTLGAGTVGAAYSASLSATGGTEPHSWGVASGSLPAGLSLNATGAISGTPTESGTFSFTARVTDAATPSQTTERGFTIQIGLPALGGVTIAVPQNPQPQQQSNVGLSIPSPFPVEISGTMTLTFQPNAVNQSDDPAIQFSTGGRSIPFTIPAGQTQAVFRVPNLAIQTGTTAGTITLASTLTAGGGAVNCPNCQLSQSISVPRTAPVITSVRVTRSATGFTVTLTGFSTTREISQGTFRFTGTNLQTTELVVPLTATFNTWFQSADSQQFGGQFTMTLPFTIQGDTSSVTSLTVILTNAVGNSQPSTANF